MSRRQEAVQWLVSGLSPSGIANKMGISALSVMAYLYTEVGEGHIRRSDILYAIPEQIRDACERALAEGVKPDSMYSAVRRNAPDASAYDIDVYVKLRDSRVVHGDMYEMIRRLELRLHGMVRAVLAEAYGEADWWRSGVPQNIRVDCATRKEKDATPLSDPFCYTTLMDMLAILDKQWSLFAQKLPEDVASDKRRLLSDLASLNRIRNAVMHPVRGEALTDKDFSFVRNFHRRLLSARPATPQRPRMLGTQSGTTARPPV
jgi:hypothetical protein